MKTPDFQPPFTDPTRLQIQSFPQWLGLLAVMGGLLMSGVIELPANTLPVYLLSTRNPSAPLPMGGDGDSIAPVISPDGRYVVFSSAANDLTPGGNSRFVLNVYLRDRTAQTTALVSANMNGTGGGNDNSMLGQVSTNGQFVVFQSDASDLVPNDTNGVTDIFMRNVTAGTTTLVSVAPDGSPGNGASTDPVMTPDGRYVAFVSSASNLVAGDTNGISDVFVRDLVLGTNYLISVGANGTNADMATPAITPDGRYVAFFSSASNLVAGIPAVSEGEVYVRDRLAGITIWASTNSSTIASNYFPTNRILSYHPRLSDDGRYVFFKISTNLYGATLKVPALIVRYDVATGATTLINTNGIGSDVDLDDDYGPEVTPDGDYVAYVQQEGNMSSDYSSVHVWDAQDSVDTLVSDPGSNGVVTTTSRQPVLSADDSSVAFLSNATNLLSNVVTGQFHIYLRNLTNGNVQLVDVDTNGIGSTDNQLAVFSLSQSSRYVAFDSPDGSLASADNNGAYDVFTRDLFSGTTEMVSKRDATVIPQIGNNISFSQPSVSSNGQWVAFASMADDLVPNDTNDVSDVFVRDLLTGTTTLVSAATNGGPALGGPSLNPVISADGRYVLFMGSATNLVVGQRNINFVNVFRRDLQTATTELVSVSTDGLDAANGDCSSPVISQDGRFAAIMSSAPNLLPGPVSIPGSWTIWRDIGFGTTVVLPTNYSAAYSVFPPSMSNDGRYVAYSSFNYNLDQSQLRVWDSQLGRDVYTNSNSADPVSSGMIDAAGDRVLYNESTPSNIALVDDVLTGTNIISFNYPIMQWSPAGWSTDGRYLAFVAQTNSATGTNIYLCDIQSGNVTLVSSNFMPLGVGGSADLPVISADGRFLVYRSYASGIVPGDTSPAPNIYRYDRLIGTNVNLTAGQVGLSPVLWDSKPVINSDGRTVAFLSLGSGLVSLDLNRAPDAFAYAIDIGKPLDTDGDGIPDWWMIQYFGHPTGQASDNSLAQDDADGTGMSNWQKYLAGLNPTNPMSVFRITSVNPHGTNTLISWQAGGGRTNVVQAAATVSGPYTNVSPDISLPGSGDVFTNYLDTTTNQPTRFYRIKLEPEAKVFSNKRSMARAILHG